MNPKTHKSGWHRRRVWLPLLFLIALAVAAVIAFARSDTSTIIVYNETGAALPGVMIRACAQSRTFTALAEEGSLRFRLEPHGAAGEIEIELATEPPTRWHGGYIEPRGGFRVALRVWPDGQFEEHTQISFWQRILKGAPNVNE